MQNNDPSLSLIERDRRYALLREQLRARGVDCAIVAGSNLTYVTNGIPGERHGLLPTEAVPPTVAVHNRNLVDLPPEALEAIRGWVRDIRPGNDASPLVQRLRELRLEHGGIGLTGSTAGYGGLSHGIYTELQSAHPLARFVDVSDIFAAVRALKSDEEVAVMERANGVFGAAIQAVCAQVRPGMLGARAVHEGTRAMWEVGGDLASTLGFSCWPVPRRNHVLSHLTLSRVIEPGDVAIVTGMASFRGYTGHGDQEICFGPIRALHRDMFEAVRSVRDAVLAEVKPGATQRQLIASYRRVCEQTGFRPSTQSQTHLCGIDETEHPGPLFAVPGDSGDFVLHAGMVYSIAPALQARDSEDMMIGGNSLVVTPSGYRELAGRSVELLSVEL